MKKFLPVVLFVMVFAIAMAAQIGWKKLNTNEVTEAQTNQYRKYENEFFNSIYPTLDGKTVELSKLESPVVLVNFWATWCRPCVDELPSLFAMMDEFNTKNLAVVAINADEDNQIKSIQEMMKKIPFHKDVIIGLDQKNSILEKFDITALPTTIIFVNGKVAEVNYGPMDFSSEENKEKIRNWVSR